MGYKPSKTIEDGIKEISEVLKSGRIKDYKDKKYSNYEILLNKKETEELLLKKFF